jgi:aldehyde dehydrogenase (NAD+)
MAGICGSQIKRCSLELGAKSAAIVPPDADRAAQSRACATAPSSASGQMQQHGGPLPWLNLVKLD